MDLSCSRPGRLPRCFTLGLTFAALAVFGGCQHEPAPTGAQRLMVTDPERRQLIIYQVEASGSASPLTVLTEDVPDQPIDVAADANGEAFVANANGNVRVYSPNPDGHYETFKHYAGSNTGLVNPTAIAVNYAGSFWVADSGGGHGRVAWFSGGANGNLTPDRVITGPDTGIHDPRGVALDGSGRVFVSDRPSNQVVVFATDANGDATPITRLGGLHQPGHLAVDPLLNLYVVNQADSSITVFGTSGPENWTLSATFTSKAMNSLTGVAADAAGEVAVGAGSDILFFAPNTQGSADPVRTLQGREPMHPAGICIH